jgi:peptidoglycan/LPS O-acetylase OafA/YrhL
VTHIRSLDGLRGIAAYMVVFAHFSNFYEVWANTLGDGVGQMGVMIFFTLSGFLMAYLYFEKPISLAGVGKFYWRRLARVYPLFAFLVLFFFAVTQLVFDGKGVVFSLNFEETLQHLTLQTGQGPLWTIPVEITFYLFVPVFWLVYRKAGFIGLAALIALILAAQQIVSFKNYFMPLNKVSLTSTIHFFLFGFLMWWLFKATSEGETTRRWLLTGYDAVFVCLLILLIPFFPNIFERWTGIQTTLWNNSVYFFYLPALLFFTAKSRLARMLLGSAVPAFFGRISYSVYVWHLPCIALVFKYAVFLTTPETRLIGTLLVVTLVSWLSYLFLEKPSRSLLNRLVGAQKPAHADPL